MSVAIGWPVVGSSAYPGAGNVVAAIRTMDRTVVPTTAPAANLVHRWFSKYVSTPIARARVTAAIR